MLRFDQDQRKIINEARAIERAARQKATRARPNSPKADRGRERDNGFRQFIRRQPCEARHKGGCQGPVQHAHISYRVAGIPNSFGRGVKNHDRYATPLCAGHHHIQTNVMGEKPFWAWVDKDPYEIAARLFAQYQEQPK